jgi:hypothetical protein
MGPNLQGRRAKGSGAPERDQRHTQDNPDPSPGWLIGTGTALPANRPVGEFHGWQPVAGTLPRRRLLLRVSGDGGAELH